MISWNGALIPTSDAHAIFSVGPAELIIGMKVQGKL